MQTQPLMAHIIVGAAQATREFRVIVAAQHFSFACRPAAWPRFHRDAAVFAHCEVAEYVGHVFTDADGKTECEVRVALTEQAAATLPPDCSQLLSAVRAAIKERTNVWMTVVKVPRSELPEFSYKARRWKDQRQQGYRL